MFDIGFWEIVVIAFCALIVLGPERLPEFTRQTSHWIKQIRRYANNVRRELETELATHKSRDFSETLSDADDLKDNAPDQENDGG